MHPTASPVRWGRWLAITVLGIVSPACGSGTVPTPARRMLLPDPQVARRALEAALNEWRDSPETDAAAANGRPLIFVDRQRRPGQKLRRFEILSVSEGDIRQRFVVRLELTEPEETVLAPYYVFDRSPVWVYRAEDFDMMMNMDMAPETVPPPSEPTPGHPGAVEADGHKSPGLDRENREKREKDEQSSS